MRSIESRVVIGPSNMLFTGVFLACYCALFNPENVRAGAVKGLKMDSDESHFKVSLTVRDKVISKTVSTDQIIPNCYTVTTRRIFF